MIINYLSKYKLIKIVIGAYRSALTLLCNLYRPLAVHSVVFWVIMVLLFIFIIKCNLVGMCEVRLRFCLERWFKQCQITIFSIEGGQWWLVFDRCLSWWWKKMAKFGNWFIWVEFWLIKLGLDLFKFAATDLIELVFSWAFLFVF
jgi:hypothetical protein